MRSTAKALLARTHPPRMKCSRSKFFSGFERLFLSLGISMVIINTDKIAFQSKTDHPRKNFCSCDLDLDLDLDPMTLIYELDLQM